jgi:hypothetical protein
MSSDKGREDRQPAAQARLLRSEPGPDKQAIRGALEILDRFPDVLGELATVALLKHAAASTVAARLRDAARPGEEDAFQVASRVALSATRLLAERSDAIEVEMTPGPALDGLRPILVETLCQGTLEAAFKSAFRSSGARAEVVGRSQGRLRIVVRRTSDG